MIAASVAQGAWLAATWLAVGGLTASWLSREGRSPSTSLAALIVWPFFLPLLIQPPHPPRTARANRIVQALQALESTLNVQGTLDATADLASLQEVLLRADDRIAWADQLLAEHDQLTHDQDSPALTALRDARDRSATDLDHVLDELLQLRLQIGLHALRGDAAPVRRTLSELRARVATLDELAQLDPSSPPTPRADTASAPRGVEG